MTKSGCACLCFLLLLVTFAQSGLGFPNGEGSVLISYGGSNQVFHDDTFIRSDGTNYSTGLQPLTTNTPFDYVVDAPVNCVKTMYLLKTPRELYYQHISSWCLAGMTFNSCMPSCDWIIDDSGFAVGSGPPFPYQRLMGWSSLV